MARTYEVNRVYELMFIVRPDMVEEEQDKLISTLESAVSSSGGKVKSMERMGKRRLACEDDMHQFGLRGLKIGEQPQSLQNFRFEILCFVHHHDQAIPFLRDLQQPRVELVVHANQILGVLLAAQFGQQEAHEFPRVALGLK